MSAKKYMPERGHIIFTDFNPSAGHEQAYQRPALVLSPAVFNKQIGLALVAPITSTVRGHGFEVPLSGEKMKTKGVILCQQIKMMDYEARGAELIESAPNKVVQEALARVRAIVS